MATGIDGLFLGVGVNRYAAVDISDLTHSAAEVSAVGALLGEHYVAKILEDPGESDVYAQLKDVKYHFVSTDGYLVLMWSGHGIPGPQNDGVRLLASDSDADVASGLSPSQLASACALSGASQILFVLDTCHSGAALNVALLVNEVFGSYPTVGVANWVGVLTSCASNELARQQSLGPRLTQLLTSGPNPDGEFGEELRRRWSPRNRLIRGADLCEALLKEWDQSNPVRPHLAQVGDSRRMIRNPLWTEVLPPVVVEDVLSGVDSSSWFTGRAEEIDKIVAWLSSDQPGVFVLTGGPGCGKTALLEHAVAQWKLPREDVDTVALSVPGSPSARAYARVNARELDKNLVAAAIDRGLVATGCLQPAEHERNAYELIGALERLARARSTTDRIPVVIIDGLDESRNEAHDIVEHVILPLEQFAIVLVATRPIAFPIPAPGRNRAAALAIQQAVEGHSYLSIVPALASAERVLDLDRPEHLKSGWRSIADYICRRLQDVSERMDPDAVLKHFGKLVEGGTSQPFLLAQLVTDQLRESPVDTTILGWERYVSSSIPDALDQAVLHLDVSQLSNAIHDTKLAARDLLTSLQWGFGAGLPEDDWLEIANIHAHRRGHPAYTTQEITWVLRQMGRYIIEDSEQGIVVFRFAHELITQHFRNRAREQSGARSPEVDVAEALLKRANALAAHNHGGPEANHLDRYLWRYIMRGGADAVAMLRGHTHQDDRLKRQLAYAALGLSIEALNIRDANRAVSWAEEAAEIWTEQGIEDGVAADVRAQTLLHLGNCYQEAGQIQQALDATDSALREYQRLVDRNGEYVPDFAAASHNHAIALMEAGKSSEAVEAASRAVNLEQAFLKRGAANHYRLGVALNTLALAQSSAGNHPAAMATSSESVQALREAVDTTGRVGDKAALADALGNHGRHVASMGDVSEGLSIALEGKRILEEALREDPGLQPRMIGCLNDLANRYSENQNILEATQCASVVVEAYRALENPTDTERSNLAGALQNLGAILLTAGRPDKAATLASDSVEISRALAAKEPARLSALAMALDNYANCLMRLREHVAALQHTEEALAIYRSALSTNPGLEPDIARVSANYGYRLANVGRVGEAVTATAAGLKTYQKLAVDNPHFMPDVAQTLSQLAIHLQLDGNQGRSAAVSKGAVELSRTLAGQGKMHGRLLGVVLSQAVTCVSGVDLDVALEYAQEAVSTFVDVGLAGSPHHASALRNLASVHGLREEFGKALDVIDLAVVGFRSIVAVEGVYRNDLASVLKTKARLEYSEGNYRAGLTAAVAAVEEFRQIRVVEEDDLEGCANVLATMEYCATELDDSDSADTYLRRVLDTLDSPQRAYLLGARASEAYWGHPQVPGWVRQALDEEPGSSAVTFSIHQVARRHRAHDSDEFDRVWGESSGELLPDWLQLNQRDIDSARQWASKSTHSEGANYLRANPRLIAEALDQAVEEAYMTVDPERVIALRLVRSAVREQGIDVGYRQPILQDLADQFIAHDLDEQVSLINERGEELRDEMVVAYLRDAAQSGDDDAKRAFNLVALSKENLHNDVARAVTDANEASAQLEKIAIESDLRTLFRAAHFISDESTARQAADVVAVSAFYLGVSSSLSNMDIDARQLVEIAAEIAPARVSGWIQSLARIGATKSEFLTAVQWLAAPEKGEE